MWTALASIAAALVGGLISYSATKKTNESNQQINQLLHVDEPYHHVPKIAESKQHYNQDFADWSVD